MLIHLFTETGFPVHLCLISFVLIVLREALS